MCSSSISCKTSYIKNFSSATDVVLGLDFRFVLRLSIFVIKFLKTCTFHSDGNDRNISELINTSSRDSSFIVSFSRSEVRICSLWS